MRDRNEFPCAATSTDVFPSIDAIAVIYMVMTLTLLMIALRFVNPTQLVARVRD